MSRQFAVVLVYCADARTAKWTNLNGSSLTSTIGYQVPANLLFFTGDIKAFNGLNNDTAVPVVRIHVTHLLTSQRSLIPYLELLPSQVNGLPAHEPTTLIRVPSYELRRELRATDFDNGLPITPNPYVIPSRTPCIERPRTFLRLSRPKLRAPRSASASA